VHRRGVGVRPRPAVSIRSLDAGRRIDLGEIGAVYLRRPLTPAPPADLATEACREYASKESEAFLHSLYPLLAGAFWLSDPILIRRAASKIRQLDVARACGLRVPDTLYTNDRDAALEFARRHDRIALKSIHQEGFVEDGEYHAFYTTILPSSGIVDDIESVPLAVNFFQEAVPKDHELRVTAVGGRLFPVRLDSQRATDLAVDDWRREEDISRIPHSICDLPDDVADGLRRFLAEYGLRFGCFDLIVDAAGRARLPGVQRQRPVALAGGPDGRRDLACGRRAPGRGVPR